MQNITLILNLGNAYNPTTSTIGSTTHEAILTALLLNAYPSPPNGGHVGITFSYNIDILVDNVVVYNINNGNVTNPVVIPMSSGYHNIKLQGVCSVSSTREYYDTIACSYVTVDTPTYNQSINYDNDWLIGIEDATVTLNLFDGNVPTCSNYTPYPQTLAVNTFVNICDGSGGFNTIVGYSYTILYKTLRFNPISLQILTDQCKGSINAFYAGSLNNIIVYHRLLDNNNNVIIDWVEGLSTVFDCLEEGTYNVQQKVCIVKNQGSNCCENTTPVIDCCVESNPVSVSIYNSKSDFTFRVTGNSVCNQCNPQADCVNVILSTPFTYTITDIVYDGNNPIITCNTSKHITVQITHLKTGTSTVFTHVGNSDVTQQVTLDLCGKWRIYVTITGCCDSCKTYTSYVDVEDYIPETFYEIIDHTCDVNCNCIGLHKPITIVSNVVLPPEFQDNCDTCDFVSNNNTTTQELITGAVNGTFTGNSSTGFFIYPGVVVAGNQVNIDANSGTTVPVLNTNSFIVASGATHIFKVKAWYNNNNVACHEKLQVDLYTSLGSFVQTIIITSLSNLPTVYTVSVSGIPAGSYYLKFSLIPDTFCAIINLGDSYFIDDIFFTETVTRTTIQDNCKGVRLTVYDNYTKEILEQTQWFPVDTVFSWEAEKHGCFDVELEYKNCCGYTVKDTRTLCTELEYRLVASSCNTAHWSTCGESRKYKSYEIYIYDIIKKETKTIINTELQSGPDFPEYVNIEFINDSVYTVILTLTGFDGTKRTFGTGHIVFCNLQECFKRVLEYVLCKDCYVDVRLEHQEIIYMEYVQELQLLMRVMEALIFRHYAESRYKETVDLGMFENLSTIAEYMTRIKTICDSCLKFNLKGGDCGCS